MSDEMGEAGAKAGSAFGKQFSGGIEALRAEANELKEEDQPTSKVPPGWADEIMAKSKLPVRIIDKGRVFVGDEEILLPIIANSVEVSRQGRRNVLHLSIVVGEVTMEGPSS